MPELPEVETVRSGLQRHLRGMKLDRTTLRRQDLRWPIPGQAVAALGGQPLEWIHRQQPGRRTEAPSRSGRRDEPVPGARRPGAARAHDLCAGAVRGFCGAGRPFSAEWPAHGRAFMDSSLASRG